MAESGHWDRQLRFSEILDDFDDQMEWMREASAAWRGAERLRRQATGRGRRQWIEWIGDARPGILLPVFVHGGYWRALDAPMHRFVLAGLSRYSGSAANVEYRLIPEVTMADQIDDVAAALECAAALAGAASLLVVGHSAGAHLALCALRRSGLEDRVAGAVVLSGIYDLLPIRESFLQAELGLDETTVEAWSPLRWTRPPAARALFATGADETRVYQLQADDIAASTGGRRLRIKSRHHLDILQLLAGDRTTLTVAIEDFLEG